MVVLVDLNELDDQVVDPYSDPRKWNLSSKTINAAQSAQVEGAADRPNPNINGFSASLGCYP
jgi:hypothetical protein